MKFSEQSEEMNHIKVNKTQKSLNIASFPIIKGKNFYSSQYKIRNSANNAIFPEMKNNNGNNNYYFFQNGINNNYLTVENYPLDETPKDFRYHKINSKRINKNENKENYSSITHNKYKKKFADDDKNKKLLLSRYKSETQYPLKKKHGTMGQNDNKSMTNLNSNLENKNMSFKHFNIPNKFNYNERTEIKNKKYFLNEDNNNIPTNNKESNNPVEIYSNPIFNKLRHNFYKPLNKQMKNKDSNSKSFTNVENNINEKNNQENINFISNNNKDDKKNHFNKTSNNDFKEIKLINIYKNKLIQIFVKLMKKFFLNYLKTIFKDLINQLKNNLFNNINSKKYKPNQLVQINEINENEFQENKPNIYYIKKGNINFPKDNNKFILAKSLSTNKNYSSMTMYPKVTKTNTENNNNIGVEYIANNTNNIISKISSSKNVYIPAKNRNMNYKKESIFNELKINKSTRYIEMNANIYPNQNINTQINNFYNTNNSNFYINKIDSLNSLMAIEKQKPKMFVSKNKQKNINQKNELNNISIKNHKNNIKCAIFKGKKKLDDVIYKKIVSKEKNKDLAYNQDPKINLFMKRMERVYNKNRKTNINEFDNVNHNQTYSIKSINNNDNNDRRNNPFSTYSNNFTADKNENNQNNYIDMSNDIDNYNLEDIDKPLNMIQIKNENEEEIQNQSNEDNEIKNIIQMKTNDKRLFLNFNYKSINNYIRNPYNRSRILLFKSKEISIYLKGNIYIEEDKNNVSNNISFNETPEKINKNLNKFMRKRKIKSGILKLDNFMNDKIYEYKTIFFEFLKGIKFRFIINQIIANRSIDILKKYFDIFKNNTKKKENYNKINNKNKILNKKNINIMIDDNNIEDINLLPNKEKLKSLVKQINKDNEKGNNISFEEEEKFYNKEDNYKTPLWKSVQDINLFSKTSEGPNSKNLYLKKKVKINNDNKKNNFNKNIIRKKMNNFRLKLIKYIFNKK